MPALALTLNDRGQVTSLTSHGIEFAAPEHDPAGLFVCQLRDFVGRPIRLSCADFRSISVSADDHEQRIQLSDCTQIPGAQATIRVTLRDSHLDWHIDLQPNNDNVEVEWLDFPRLRLRRHRDGKLLLPFAEGILIDDPRDRRTASFNATYADYPMTGVSSFYPGPAPLQFEAYYTEQAGLYIDCPDAAHTPKTVDAFPDGDDAIRLMLQHFTQGIGSPAYAVRTIAFHGDWQDAALIYRDWTEASDPTLPETLEHRLPEWLADSPVILAYSVKGNGLDAGGVHPNEYYPYANILPVVEKYSQLWKCQLMTLLMHWEGTAPWAPPYVWPPYGGEDQMRQFVDAMHQRGHRVGLYCSGIGWTQRSMIDTAYDRRDQFEREHLATEMCLGPRGEMFSNVCNGLRGQRLGYDLCPTRDFTVQTVRHEVAAASACGIDYMQYFDQNQGCAAPLCYSHDHGHPHLPGPWHTQAMSSLLEQAADVAGETVLGCENAAAQPYIRQCQLNDLRSHLAWGAGGKPVPLYPFVLHQYVCGFSGNGVCLSSWVDIHRTPFFLRWHLAWHFASGNVLSLVLKDGGKLHWHWAIPWAVQEPEQESLITLVANLTAWRRTKARPYLVAGRMEKMPAIVCGHQTIHLRQRNPEQTARVIATAWSAAGKQAILLVNYGTQPEPCRLDLPEAFSGTLHTLDDAQPIAGTSLTLTVPPLQALMLETN